MDVSLLHFGASCVMWMITRVHIMPAGRIFAIGGMNGQRKRLASVEALDPREGQWHCLPTISSPRSASASEPFNILSTSKHAMPRASEHRLRSALAPFQSLQLHALLVLSHCISPQHAAACMLLRTPRKAALDINKTVDGCRLAGAGPAAAWLRWAASCLWLAAPAPWTSSRWPQSKPLCQQRASGCPKRPCRCPGQDTPSHPSFSPLCLPLFAAVPFMRLYLLCALEPLSARLPSLLRLRLGLLAFSIASKRLQHSFCVGLASLNSKNCVLCICISHGLDQSVCNQAAVCIGAECRMGL